MRRTFKYRARINKEAETNCNKWLWACRTLYNLGLEQRILSYKQFKKSISVYEQMKQLPELKQEFPDFKTVNSQALQEVLRRLDRTFQSFFKNGFGFPRFKSRNRYHSFTLTQSGWKLEGRYLHVKNIGKFKLFHSRPIEGTIKTVTIKRTSTNKWFVSFSCDDVPVKELPETNAEIGIDVGIKHFLVDSDGNSVENPKYFRKSEKLLKRRQRKLSRKKRGSNRRGKARILVAKAHEKIVNQRNDFLHKAANALIKLFGTIYIENLNIKGMVRNRHLSKSIADSSWGKLFDMLIWKVEGTTRQVVKVAARNTSQNCSGCGIKVPKSLSIRVHKCPHCGLVLDRDHNAAINILRAGQALQASTPAIASVA